MSRENDEKLTTYREWYRGMFFSSVSILNTKFVLRAISYLINYFDSHNMKGQWPRLFEVKIDPTHFNTNFCTNIAK